MGVYMKNNNIVYKIAGICILICSYCTIQTGPQIVVTLQPFSQMAQQTTQATFTKSLQKPGKVGSTLLRYGHRTPLQAGIFATYWGYLGVSDFNGKLSFIRHTVKPKVKLLVTQQIEPVMMFGTIVRHWTLKPRVPAALFSMERHDAKPVVWSTEELPVDYEKPISLDTIVIFAHPSKLHIPTGEQPARRDPNLILPPIFAKRGIEKTANALRVLTMRHFFSPVRFVEKKVNNTYYSELLTP